VIQVAAVARKIASTQQRALGDFSDSTTRTIFNMTQTSSFKAWIIWALGALFYFYEFALQASPSVMVPELMRDLHVNATQLGNLSAFYFYAYAAMQIPVGLLLDRYGPRSLLTIASLICALGAFCFAQTTSLALAEAARFLMGIGSAFAFVSCMKLAALWFPQRRFALLAGLIITFGMLGAIGGQAPLALLIDAMGWRHSMLLLAVVGIVLSVLISSFVRNGPRFEEMRAKLGSSFSWHGLRNILFNPQAWLMAIYGGLMFAPTPAFGELWGVPYMMSIYNVTKPVAAQVISLIFIGWAIGGPLFGWLSDHFGKRLPFMWIGVVGNIILMAGILFGSHDNLTRTAVLLFLFGIFSSAFLTVFSLLKETNPEHVTGTAVGFLNMLNTLGPALLQPVFGMMLDHSSTSKTIDGVRIYAASDYHFASFALMAVLGAALITICFIRSKK
jgi:MFS family permease